MFPVVHTLQRERQVNYGRNKLKLESDKVVLCCVGGAKLVVASYVEFVVECRTLIYNVEE